MDPRESFVRTSRAGTLSVVRCTVCASAANRANENATKFARERASLRPSSGVESRWVKASDLVYARLTRRRHSFSAVEELASGCPGCGSEEGMHATRVGALYAPLWFTYECIAPPCSRLAVSPPPSPAGLSSRLQGQLGPLVLRSVDDNSGLATDDSEHLFTVSRPLAPGRLPRAAIWTDVGVTRTSCSSNAVRSRSVNWIWGGRGLRGVLATPRNPLRAVEP